MANLWMEPQKQSIAQSNDQTITQLTAGRPTGTMDRRQQILDVPRSLRDTLEKGRLEFESVIRRVRWGEGPVFMVGTGSSFLAALTGAHAFEDLLGWRVIAQAAGGFNVDGLPVTRPRSVVLALSNSGESAGKSGF